MKKIILAVLLLLPAAIFAQEMNIMTFNIRFNNPRDAENAWPNRVEMVGNLLRFYDPDIFGMQEALIGQIEDVQNQLPDYKWFGVGREDGKNGGEFSPVFYNPAKLILLEHNTFWLSETPEKPSKGWDAALNRVVTWGKFQSKVTGKQFLVFNTHFDHIGDEARKNSADLIKKKIQEIIKGKNLPVILTGDFNLTPDKEPIMMLKKFMSDSREVSEESPFGPVGTFSGFDIDADLSSRRIDYIFVHGDIKVLEYAALSNFSNHRFPSDHLPVFVQLQLK